MSCEYVEAKHHPTGSTCQTHAQSTNHTLKYRKLFPDQHGSMDDLKVSEHGCLYTSMGSTYPETTYASGCLFLNHTSGDVHVECFINLTTTETILAKCHYEK